LTKDLVFHLGEASGEDIEKLRADNRDLLNQLRRENAELYREILAAAEARRAELNQGAT
jgi:hypothetical protein